MFQLFLRSKSSDSGYFVCVILFEASFSLIFTLYMVKIPTQQFLYCPGACIPAQFNNPQSLIELLWRQPFAQTGRRLVAFRLPCI